MKFKNWMNSLSINFNSYLAPNFIRLHAVLNHAAKLLIKLQCFRVLRNDLSQKNMPTFK